MPALSSKLPLILTLVFAALASAPAHAARIYRLVERPEHQQSQTLYGTITTADDAPADGLLALSEILAWQYSTQGTRRPINANSTQRSTDGSEATGVVINAQSIELPPRNSLAEMFRRLELARYDPSGRGSFGSSLSWSTAFDQSLGPRFDYRSNDLDGDVIFQRWFSVFPSPTGGSLVIATAIPEPATLSLLTIAALATAALSVPLRRFTR